MKKLYQKIRISTVTFIFILITNLTSLAQWNASINLDQEYNSNPFRSPEAHPSWISNINGKLQYDWQKYAMRYYGSYLKFDLMPERNFYWHQFAFWGGSDTLNYGATVEQRFDRSDYSIYDYTSSSAYLNYRYNISGIWFTSTNNLSLNNYSQLEQLSNWQFNSRLQLNKGFQTKTSVISGFGLYFKKYLPTNDEYVSSGIDTIYSRQNFYGNGKGRGQGVYLSPINEYLPSESPSLAQFLYWFRVAQSVTTTTGLAIQVQERLLIKGLDRYISGLSYDYNSESQLFDDPMGYESFSIGSELTKLLAKDFRFKLAYYWNHKNYISQGIYMDSENFNENVLRDDINKTVWLTLAKEIYFSETSDQGLLLLFNFQQVKNNSNSYWYNYSNKSWSIGLEYSL